MSHRRAEALADASALFLDSNRRSQRFLLPAATLLLLAIALSQPRWGVERRQASRPNDEIWIVFELGSTMRCRDLPGGRGEFAKNVADLVLKQWSGRARVSTLARDAQLLSPATTDLRRTRRMIDRLAFDGTSDSSWRAVVDLIENAPLDTPYFGVLFSDGGCGEMEAKNPGSAVNGRWIVVGLGDAGNGTPVPGPDGGWVLERGAPVVSKRNDAALEKLSAALSASLLTAWPDAEGVASEIVQQIRRVTLAEESIEFVPREQFQWIAAAALALLFQPWKWRLRMTPAALLLAFFLTGERALAGDDAAYRSARAELIAGRWLEARSRFEGLAADRKLAGWAHWGAGVASASLAKETQDPKVRRELTASAIRSFREAAQAARDSAERIVVITNIEIAKRTLEVSGSPKSSSQTPLKGESAKNEEQRAGANFPAGAANPNLERKSGGEIGGGAVARPVAGLNITDPGRLSRKQAEAMIDRVVENADGASRRRAAERSKE